MLRSVCGCRPRQSGDRICFVAVSMSLPGSTLLGEPPSGMAICALLSRSHAGGATGFFICACTKNTDDQPGGTFTGATLMVQVSTGPTCGQVHAPKTLAGALTPSVSLTWIGPL